MANIAIFRINYKSDFILTLNSDAGWMTPFCIKFWTSAPSQAYFVGFDGTTYTHCAPVAGEPTKLLVQFDDHHLPIGDLKFQIGYHFTVADFPTSVEDEVINQASVIIEVDDAPAQVMLDLNGETAPEIEFSLPAYANEAQRIANEQQRIANEQTRIQNEEARIAAEATRQQNESQRIRQEEARVSEFAQLKLQSQDATSAANTAAALANEKAQLAADKAELAGAAATLANAKAQLAADKAALAASAAQLANDKAALAQQKAEYAQQQGDYAKAQGDTALADHRRAESDHTTAADDHTRAESDHGIAADDHTQAGNDHTRAESDHGIAADDHTRAGNDHTRAESDHGIAADDHTQAGNDHTRAESDHGIAADDHTQAGNDHTRAESDHTRAEQDHTDVQNAIEAADLVYDISKANAVGGVMATYADLSAALGVDGANVPVNRRQGGMTVKFVLTSDNKYVQYRLMLSTFTAAQFAAVGNWQGTDDIPIKDSHNLIKSSAVANALNPNIPLFEIGSIAVQNNGYDGNRESTTTVRTTYFIRKDLYSRIYFVNPERDALRMGVFYYDKNYNYLQYVNWEVCGNDYTLINVPNSVYIRVIVYHYPSATMNPSIITEDVIRFVGTNIDIKVEALSNLNNYNEGFVLGSGGVLQQNTSFITTPYIPCTPQDIVKWYWKNLDYQPTLYVFDENKNYIDYFGPGVAGATSRTVNLSSVSGAAYIRVSFKPSQLDAAYVSINGEIVWYANNIYRGDINGISNDINTIKQDIQSLSETIGDTVPQLTWINGYVQKNTGQIFSSTASKVSQPFLLKEGQTISVSTDNRNTSFINSTTSESIAVGSLVNPLANVTTDGYITKEYTATEDTLIVVSVKKASYEININNNDSLVIRIKNLENKVIDLENEEENNKLLVYGEKLIKQTYTGERISLFDDSSVNYERKQFSTIPFESTRNQSFAINGEYIIFLFHDTMNGVMYRLTDNTKVCDLSFPTDSTYGGSHNNACGFGKEKYSDDSVFPMFYISQFNTGTKGYLAYDLVTNSDGTYTPKLVQIIVPSSELMNNDSFGLGPGDYCIDKDNDKLYRIGYKLNQIGGNVMVSKFNMPTKEDGIDFVSSTGDTIKVVTLNISDMEDSFNIGNSLLQDNCYYKGNIIKTGSFLTFIDLETKNVRSLPVNIGNGFGESEGIDVYMDRLIMNYWGKQGIFEFKF